MDVWMMMEEEYHQASSINSNDDEGWMKDEG